MRRRLIALIAAAAATACASGPDDSGTLGQSLTLDLTATLGGQPVSCSSEVAAGTGDTPVQLADARAYLSAIELRDGEGRWVPLTLDETDWQHDGVALVDFEDGTGACADSGTADTNTAVSGSVPEGTYDAVRFDLGVPFALNHNDSATAPAPLNAPGMFWTWQGGYKFARVDFAVQSDPPSRWNVHLGSTGCVSDAPVIAPDEPCSRPNRPTIEVELDPDADALQIDLLALVGGSDLSANTADTPPGCMSNPAEPDDCTPVFDALGLDFATGSCTTDCADQDVFDATAR